MSIEDCPPWRRTRGIQLLPRYQASHQRETITI